MNSVNTDAIEGLSAADARGLALELNERADSLKRRARALLAFADALDADADEPTGTNGHRPRDPSNPWTERVEGKRRPPAAPASNKRPLIRSVIEERPTPGWTPALIHDRLIQKSLIPGETTKASINVTVRRMYTAREIGKTGDGLYTTRDHAALMWSDDGDIEADFGGGTLLAN